MAEIDELLRQFRYTAAHPGKLKEVYLAQGKQIVACFPYYVPEEIIEAAGMVPMGLWGCNGAPSRAKEYFPSIFCSIAQMGMEMVLDGTLDGICAVVCPSMCDTLRPLTQNLKSAGRYPVIFLAHPQNRRKDYGRRFTRYQYENMKKQLEELSGRRITGEAIREAILLYNRNREACREFVRLAGLHPEIISAVDRGAVLKSRHFLRKREHTECLEALNAELLRLPVQEWEGTRVVLSGIIADNPNYLKLFDQNHIAIAADDLAHESRTFRKDAAEDGDPMDALAGLFASQGDDTVLYDPDIVKRPDHIINLVKMSGAQGVVTAVMTFCDPEEIEIPYLKKRLEEAGIPMLIIGYDQTMSDFGQASTALESFRDVLELKK